MKGATMRMLLGLFIVALTLSAASIEIVVKDDSGKVLSTANITVTSEVVAAIKSWQSAQISRPAEAAQLESRETDIGGKEITRPAVGAKQAVLQYPTDTALWKELLARMLQGNSILKEHLPAVMEERQKAAAASAKAAELEQGAIR